MKHAINQNIITTNIDHEICRNIINSCPHPRHAQIQPFHIIYHQKKVQTWDVIWGVPNLLKFSKMWNYSRDLQCLETWIGPACTWVAWFQQRLVRAEFCFLVSVPDPGLRCQINLGGHHWLRPATARPQLSLAASPWRSGPQTLSGVCTTPPLTREERDQTSDTVQKSFLGQLWTQRVRSSELSYPETLVWCGDLIQCCTGRSRSNIVTGASQLSLASITATTWRHNLRPVISYD